MTDEKTLRYELTESQVARITASLKAQAAAYQALGSGADRKIPPTNRQTYLRVADEMTLMSREIKQLWEQHAGGDLDQVEALVLDFDRERRENRQRAIWQAALAVLPGVMARHGWKPGDVVADAHHLAELMVETFLGEKP